MAEFTKEDEAVLRDLLRVYDVETPHGHYALFLAEHARALRALFESGVLERGMLLDSRLVTAKDIARNLGEMDHDYTALLERVARAVESAALSAEVCARRAFLNDEDDPEEDDLRSDLVVKVRKLREEARRDS